MATETIRITDIEYDDEHELIVRVVGRRADGERVVKEITGTEPYFFISTEVDPKPRALDAGEHVEYVGGGYQTYDGERVMKVVAEYPKHVKELREEYNEMGVETYEADIPFERRCTADYGLSGYVRVPTERRCSIGDVESLDASAVEEPIDPRIAYVDIEAIPPETWYDDFATEAPNKVTAITAYDNYDDEYVLFCLDPDERVDAYEIIGHIEEQWDGYENEEEYVAATIELKRYLSEADLLAGFIEYIQAKRPDTVTGWNYVDFDHQYLLNRIGYNEKLNEYALSDVGTVQVWRRPKRMVPGMPAIDMMEAVQKIEYGQMESWSLDFIANEFVGVGKVEGSDVSWHGDRSKFMAYNIVDTQLCVAIDRQRQITQFWYQIEDICSIPIYDVGSTMKECEGYLFKHRSNEEILPDTEDESIEDISGGFVMPPYDGVEDWVGVTDLKSLYPSSIISCNISKERMTYDPDEADVIVPDMPLNYERSGGEITEDDIGWELGPGKAIGFSLNEQGILPKYLRKLFRDREALKSERDQYDPESVEYDVFDSQQRAIKVLMNSFFGVSDHPYFRLSEDGLGEAITAASRYVQWYGVQIIESKGYDVIYGDTDSLVVSLADGTEDVEKADVIDRGLSLEESLNRDMEPIADDFGLPAEHPYLDADLHGNERHCWVYEFEKLYRRYLQPGRKKRYAGSVVWKEGKEVDSLDAVGFEAVRADSPEITKRVQQEFLERVLDGESFEELSTFVQKQIEMIESGDYSIREIGVPGAINKPIEEYPNGPVKRAVQYSDKYLGYDWQVGDDPWIVYVDEVYGPPTDVIAMEWTEQDLPEGYSLNVDEHVRVALEQPLSGVLEALEFGWVELKSGKREQSVLESLGGGSEGEKSGHDRPRSSTTSSVLDWGGSDE